MTNHIKIYGVKPRIQYVADGTSVVYEFPFAIFKTADIEVYLADTKQDTSTYTVSEARHSDGGTVTFESAPASGTIITIVRNLSIERTSDFQEGSTLRAKVLNDELDYQIACQQQIAENLNRSMVLPPYATDNDLDLTLPTPSAGKAIVWNSDGTNLENSTVEVNALENILKGYKESAESAAAMATIKAGVASDKADIATAKAEIATEKATEVSSALSTKANKDMDNLSTTGKENLVSLAMPDYSAGVSKTKGTIYQAECDGFIYVLGKQTSTSQAAFALTIGAASDLSDGVQIAQEYSSPNTHLDASCFIPISKGLYYRVKNDTYANTITFYPVKGEVNA